MNNIEEKTVAECVTENYKAADIFKKRGIDFCCGGKVLVKDICEKKKVSYEEIKQELLDIDQQVDNAHDFNSWNLSFLTDYIINTHHKYVQQNVPLIIEYSDKVARVHGHYHTEVVEINNLFHAVAEELTMHMGKEEQILFPFIKKIAEAYANGKTLEPTPFGSIANPIRMMEVEHDSAGDLLKQIAQLSNNYMPPEGACNTFRVLYAKLKEFEEDLHQHIHLENNILFPKIIEIEKSMM